ncbi:putative uncharacterized protein DDB_G0279653 [Clytia hemisphaerica]|uniref:Uncharacterized protein n=2 Tax=Clytia hemisphaerica TaxID=252671 RepID=A0A7M5X0T9_9CNID
MAKRCLPSPASYFHKKRPHISSDVVSQEKGSRLSDTEDIQKSQTPKCFDEIINRKYENGKLLSIADLPHPSTLHRHKNTSKYRRKKYSVVENYLQQLKKKQSDFQWNKENPLETSFALDSSATLSSTQQSTDHVVPNDLIDNTCNTFNNKLNAHSQQVVPTNNNNSATSSRLMVSSQQVTRSPILTNGNQESNDFDHTGYRQYARLQQHHNSKRQHHINQPNNSNSLFGEANRFLTTGEVTRDSMEQCSTDAQNVYRYHGLVPNKNSNSTTGSYCQTSDSRHNNERLRVSKSQNNNRFQLHTSLETQLHHHDSFETRNPQPPSELSQLFSFQLPRSDIYPDEESEEYGRDQVSLLDENGLLVDRAKKNLFGSEKKVVKEESQFEMDPFKKTSSTIRKDNGGLARSDSYNLLNGAEEERTNQRGCIWGEGYWNDTDDDEDEDSQDSNLTQEHPLFSSKTDKICGVDLPPDLEYLENLIDILDQTQQTQKNTVI